MKFKMKYLIIPIIVIIFLSIVSIVLTPFIGNPIVSLIEYPKMKSYITKKYPNLNLHVSFPVSSYGSNNYSARVYSKSNSLIDFNLWQDKDNGGYCDGYEEVVLSGYTTTNAWQEDYDKVIKYILNDIKSSNFKDSSTHILLYVPYQKPFDINYPVVLRLNLYFRENDFSAEKLAQIVLETHENIQSKGINAEYYNFYFSGNENNSKRLDISDISPQYINNDLIDLFKEMQNDYQGVYSRTGIGWTYVDVK